jgi:hypothetical protein
VIRIYTFTVQPPPDFDVLAAGKLMTRYLDQVAARSKELLEAVIEATEDGRLVLTLTYQARDQWYIHKKIKFPLVAALRRVGLTMEHVKSTQVSAPTSGRDRPAARMPPPA